MLKKTFFLFILPALILGFVYRHGFRSKASDSLGLPSLQDSSNKAAAAALPDHSREIAAQKMAREKRLSSMSPKEREKLSARAGKYFDKLLEGEGYRKLYEDSQKIFGQSESGSAAARWVTLGLKFDSSKAYGETLESAAYEINQSPESVYGSIQEHLSEIRTNTFIYEMSQNLVYQLDLPVEKKAQFYGQEFQYQMAQGKVDDSFWVSTLGLYLARQSGVPADQMASYLSASFANSKVDPKIQQELKQTVAAYYPGIQI